jgi:8-oxo-dGTP pyrophosphatase MutT (NUDIX family)
MNYKDLTAKLEERINLSKPGLKAQLSMCPEPRPGHTSYSEDKSHCKKAGVLVLLYPWRKRTYLTLTIRTDSVFHHKNQISFPGGQNEPGESIQETALRETYEELGLPPEFIRTIGELTPLYVPPSNFCIYPIVGTMQERPVYKVRSMEVAEVIETPLDHLLDKRNLRKEIWTRGQKEVKVPFYYFGGYKIWGATAMILAEFLEIVRS